MHDTSSAENPDDVNADNVSEGPASKKPRTTKEKVQKFKNEWIREAEYNCFERYENDESFAWCKVCLDKLSIRRGGKSNLASHILTKRHKEAASKIVADDDTKLDNFAKTEDPDEILTTQAELRISAWAVENNVSFNSIDKLTDVLRTIDPNSKALNNIKLGRTKVTAVVESWQRSSMLNWWQK